MTVETHEHDRWECPYFTSDPEHYGFEEIGSINTGGYDWHLVGVWRRISDNGLFWYNHGGCSCNSPDDDLPNELEALPSVETFLRALFDLECYGSSGAQKVELLRKVTAVVS